jgi:hypothetical protein
MNFYFEMWNVLVSNNVCTLIYLYFIAQINEMNLNFITVVSNSNNINFSLIVYIVAQC